MDIGLDSLTVEFLIRVVGFFGLIFDLDIYFYYIYMFFFIVKLIFLLFFLKFVYLVNENLGL